MMMFGCDISIALERRMPVGWIGVRSNRGAAGEFGIALAHRSLLATYSRPARAAASIGNVHLPGRSKQHP